MKITKKAISFVLSMMIVFGAVAVTTVSTSAAQTYNPDIIYTYDSTLRDYSYGTGEGAHWPVNVTYNKTGWMRWQSKTEEQIANNEKGTYALQWQWHGMVTPEFKKQFNLGVNSITDDDSDGYMTVALYLVSASTLVPKGGQKDNDGIQFEPTFTVRRYRADNTYSDYPITQQLYNMTYGDLWTAKFDVSAMIEPDYVKYELIGVTINVQDYRQGWDKNAEGERGIGNLDIYISPAYNPDSVMPEMGDASEYTTEFNEADWKFQSAAGAGVGVFGKDDIEREKDTNRPIKADGTVYAPMPKSLIEFYVKPAKVQTVKATVSGRNVTVSWNADANATSYKVFEKGNQVTAKTVTGTSCTFTNLTPGKTYNFAVIGVNTAGTGPQSDPATAKIAATLSVSGSSSVNAGKTITLKASTAVKSWSSSSKSIATVSSKGVVKGLKKGTVNITVIATNGAKYVKRITVKSSISKIKLNKTKQSLKKGKTYTLKATVTASYAKSLVSWKTSNKKIVTVKNGKIKAVKKGKATITCYATDGSGKKATCKITVK